MILRFSSSTLTGIERTLVAVGTVRLCSIFSTIFLAGPVMGLVGASVGMVGVGFGAGCVAAASGGTLPTGRVSAFGWPSAPEIRSLKNVCHDSSTDFGSDL